ncbi:hypothetical protein CEXT_692961 [Caerostris extrusa]|uniref:Uncharacterized protein n=1 Tax=Caerostris extrusa TaxID=172846 RepID=A0AAV4Y318_CAEEX|nr:hypothetical protein CEXT_692961 [Caerostris extrusa]
MSMDRRQWSIIHVRAHNQRVIGKNYWKYERMDVHIIKCLILSSEAAWNSFRIGQISMENSRQRVLRYTMCVKGARHRRLQTRRGRLVWRKSSISSSDPDNFAQALLPPLSQQCRIIKSRLRIPPDFATLQ